MLFGSDVILAAKPVPHAPLQAVEGDAIAGFENAVGDRERVVEDGVVGEVPHREAVDPLDGTRMSDARGVDAFDTQGAGEHAQAKRVNIGESTGTV